MNLDNPLLTSLSDGTCPFSSGTLTAGDANAASSSASSSAIASAASSGNNRSGGGNNNNNNNNNNKQTSTTSTTGKAGSATDVTKMKKKTDDLTANVKKPAPSPSAAGGKKEVDYLKLAEDVDEWLASGGWS